MIDQCVFPRLASPYAQALRQAVEFILTRTTPIGIVASGTILRGKPDPASDLDLFVIHQQSYRQRIQRIFNGVPAEIFINTPAQVRHYLKEEQAEYRPITAHMLATGFVILEADPVVAELHQEALKMLQTPPPQAGPETLTSLRYMAASWLEDAADLIPRDETTANLFLSQAVFEMIHANFIIFRKNLPRNKELVSGTEAINPELGQLLREFYQSASPAGRLELAYQIADRTIQAHGFFEWESTPQEVGEK